MINQQQILSRLVPPLLTQAGSSLTYANWENAGVQIASFHLADLLMKPGFSVLTKSPGLRCYFNWSGEVVLNAMLPPPNREDVYSIRSLYDGSIIQIDAFELFALIGSLQPDKVILPLGSASYLSQFWKQLPAETMVYLHYNETLPEIGIKTGRYLMLKPEKPFSLLLEEMNARQEHFYIVGEFDIAEMKQLASAKKYLFESDKPAKDGMIGLVYTSKRAINILEPMQASEHQAIENSCRCQTCSLGLTRAYLHHLLQQTPLLAQRYLIQHNVYFTNSFTSE